MALPANSYCAFVQDLSPDDLHRKYHDRQYGFPLADDNELLGRLILEINQAGLSWTTILRKQDNFRAAYSNFDVKTIANYGEMDFERLKQDAGIIRNSLKIKAAIHNAQAVLKIQAEHGSFRNWILKQGDLELAEWVKRFRKIFKFTGPEIVNEFLMSTGFKEGAHHPECKCYALAKAEIAEHYAS